MDGVGVAPVVAPVVALVVALMGSHHVQKTTENNSLIRFVMIHFVSSDAGWFHLCCGA